MDEIMYWTEALTLVSKDMDQIIENYKAGKPLSEADMFQAIMAMTMTQMHVGRLEDAVNNTLKEKVKRRFRR